MGIPINLVVEDPLSETVARVILRDTGRDFFVQYAHGLKGFQYIKRNIKGFNNASRFTPYFILTDLDNGKCAPALIQSWFARLTKHTNCIFRVAVREVEAWLLADSEGFSKFLGISSKLIPNFIEDIERPKEFLISLAKKSRYRHIKEDIIPSSDLTKVGPDYNGRLSYFVQNEWRLSTAQKSSKSLDKAIRALKNFRPCISVD